MENSSGSEIFMVIIRIMMDSEILRISSTSSTLGCSGITRNRTMTTTIRDIALLSIRLIRYEMDKLNFNWRMNQMNFTFVPGDIEFTMTQRPDVIIKYVGGPLYVPPSSDPNYEPIDMQA